jgi:hypothetical protein
MFGHLKAEEFVNLMEGGIPPVKQKKHLETCPSCQATFESLQSIQAGIESLDSGIPEPDWAEFRGTVRDALLSRSIQRDSSVRRWTGWAVRPGLVWAMTLFLAIGVTTVSVLWDFHHHPGTGADSSVTEPAAETVEVPDRRLFDDVVSLDDEQQEQLQQMLVSAQKAATIRQ